MSSNLDFKSLLGTIDPPQLGPGPRPGVTPEPALNRELSQCFESSGLPRQNQELIRALLLLWHDHLDASHTIAQNIDNADGSFVHGIMHRREPDYGNAKYWFRHVGNHPAYGPLAQRAKAYLETNGQKELISKLIPKRDWDAFAFVDACEQAAHKSLDEPSASILRQLQRIETEVLLERFTSA